MDTYRLLGLYMLVDSLGIGHILEHDLANLQRSFAEPDLQNLNISPLQIRRVFMRKFNEKDGMVTYFLLDLIGLIITSSEQSLGQQNLKFFYEEIL